MEISKRDRYRGVMVGTLAGDAIGAPVEWKDPGYIQNFFVEHGFDLASEYELFDYIEPWKGRRMVKAGHPTDDSELAAALAQSLVAYPEFNPEDLYYRLRNFIHGNTPEGRKSVLTGEAYGSGGTLREALRPATYEESRAKFALGEIPTPPSNGSLMRTESVSLRAGADTNKASSLAARQSAVTHQNGESIAACVAYNITLCHVLGGMDIRDAWNAALEELGSPKNMLFTEIGDPPVRLASSAIENVANISLTKPNYVAEIKDKEGYVVLSLRVALWAAAEATDFADGIMKAISVGGDTDTYAAIAGGHPWCQVRCRGCSKAVARSAARW